MIIVDSLEIINARKPLWITFENFVEKMRYGLIGYKVHYILG